MAASTASHVTAVEPSRLALCVQLSSDTGRCRMLLFHPQIEEEEVEVGDILDTVCVAGWYEEQQHPELNADDSVKKKWKQLAKGPVETQCQAHVCQLKLPVYFPLSGQQLHRGVGFKLVEQPAITPQDLLVTLDAPAYHAFSPLLTKVPILVRDENGCALSHDTYLHHNPALDPFSLYEMWVAFESYAGLSALHSECPWQWVLTLTQENNNPSLPMPNVRIKSYFKRALLGGEWCPAVGLVVSTFESQPSSTSDSPVGPTAILLTKCGGQAQTSRIALASMGTTDDGSAEKMVVGDFVNYLPLEVPSNFHNEVHLALYPKKTQEKFRRDLEPLKMCLLQVPNMQQAGLTDELFHLTFLLNEEHRLTRHGDEHFTMPLWEEKSLWLTVADPQSQLARPELASHVGRSLTVVVKPAISLVSGCIKWNIVEIEPGQLLSTNSTHSSMEQSSSLSRPYSPIPCIEAGRADSQLDGPPTQQRQSPSPPSHHQYLASEVEESTMAGTEFNEESESSRPPSPDLPRVAKMLEDTVVIEELGGGGQGASCIGLLRISCPSGEVSTEAERPMRLIGRCYTMDDSRKFDVPTSPQVGNWYRIVYREYSMGLMEEGVHTPMVEVLNAEKLTESIQPLQTKAINGRLCFLLPIVIEFDPTAMTTSTTIAPGTASLLGAAPLQARCRFGDEWMSISEFQQQWDVEFTRSVLQSGRASRLKVSAWCWLPASCGREPLLLSPPTSSSPILTHDQEWNVAEVCWDDRHKPAHPGRRPDEQPSPSVMSRSSSVTTIISQRALLQDGGGIMKRNGPALTTGELETSYTLVYRTKGNDVFLLLFHGDPPADVLSSGRNQQNPEKPDTSAGKGEKRWKPTSTKCYSTHKSVLWQPKAGEWFRIWYTRYEKNPTRIKTNGARLPESIPPLLETRVVGAGTADERAQLLTMISYSKLNRYGHRSFGKNLPNSAARAAGLHLACDLGELIAAPSLREVGYGAEVDQLRENAVVERQSFATAWVQPQTFGEKSETQFLLIRVMSKEVVGRVDQKEVEEEWKAELGRSGWDGVSQASSSSTREALNAERFASVGPRSTHGHSSFLHPPGTQGRGKSGEEVFVGNVQCKNAVVEGYRGSELSVLVVHNIRNDNGLNIGRRFVHGRSAFPSPPRVGEWWNISYQRYAKNGTTNAPSAKIKIHDAHRLDAAEEPYRTRTIDGRACFLLQLRIAFPRAKGGNAGVPPAVEFEVLATGWKHVVALTQHLDRARLNEMASNRATPTLVTHRLAPPAWCYLTENMVDWCIAEVCWDDQSTRDNDTSPRLHNTSIRLGRQDPIGRSSSPAYPTGIVQTDTTFGRRSTQLSPSPNKSPNSTPPLTFFKAKRRMSMGAPESSSNKWRSLAFEKSQLRFTGGTKEAYTSLAILTAKDASAGLVELLVNSDENWLVRYSRELKFFNNSSVGDWFTLYQYDCYPDEACIKVNQVEYIEPGCEVKIHPDSAGSVEFLLTVKASLSKSGQLHLEGCLTRDEPPTLVDLDGETGLKLRSILESEGHPIQFSAWCSPVMGLERYRLEEVDWDAGYSDIIEVEDTDGEPTTNTGPPPRMGESSDESSSSPPPDPAMPKSDEGRRKVPPIVAETHEQGEDEEAEDRPNMALRREMDATPAASLSPFQRLLPPSGNAGIVGMENRQVDSQRELDQIKPAIPPAAPNELGEHEQQAVEVVEKHFKHTGVFCFKSWSGDDNHCLLYCTDLNVEVRLSTDIEANLGQWLRFNLSSDGACGAVAADALKITDYQLIADSEAPHVTIPCFEAIFMKCRITLCSKKSPAPMLTQFGAPLYDDHGVIGEVKKLVADQKGQSKCALKGGILAVVAFCKQGEAEPPSSRRFGYWSLEHVYC